jgi:peptidoglycan hydrolase-like protein with peptidoglycan-binding domain
LKVKLFFIFLLVFNCGGSTVESEIQNALPNENSIQQEVVETTILNPTTTTSTLPTPECVPQDNSVFNFENISVIQNFLNRNGFNAGVEDGYIGNQTINAIKKFQKAVGLISDGDAGPMTIEAMKLWDGCEDIDLNLITVSSTTTTVLAQDTTTTTIPTTTTTVISTKSSTESDFFYQGTISLENGNFNSYLTTNIVESTFCTFTSPNREFFQQNSLGMPSNAYQYSSMPELIQGVSTQIISNSSNQFEVEVLGNGDENFRFYFVKPFTSRYIELIPSEVIVSSGRTLAKFSKSNLTNGYWFYGYADNGGGYIKATGLKEVLVGNQVVQEDVSFTKFHDIWINSNSGLISNGKYIDNNETLYLNYLTDRGFNTYSQLSEPLDASSTTLKLKNGEDYGIGDILLLNKEYLYVTDKSNATLSVERGYRNSLIQNHTVDTDVKKLVNKTDMRAVSGYAVFKGEKGFTFTVPLSHEGNPVKINISDNCPKDLYSLDYIKVFSWREKGKATVTTIDDSRTSSIINNDSFTTHQGIVTYIYPDIFGSNSENGEFLNTGPRDITYELNDYIEFDFDGITKGSSEIDYVEIEFKLISTGDKQTKFRKVIFSPTEDKFTYLNLIESISNTTSTSNYVWENGYQYFINYIKVNDGSSEVIFYSNGNLLNRTTGVSSKHDFYYLDQFVFKLRD